MSESASVLLAVLREVLSELAIRQLPPTPRNFELVCEVVCNRLGVFATLAPGDELRLARAVRAELSGALESCFELLSRIAPDRPEVLAAVAGFRDALGAMDPGALHGGRQTLAAQLRTLDVGGGVAASERSMLRGVLRTIAEYLTAATAGSAQFGARAEEIRRRVESADGIDDLRLLQGLLVEAAATAAREARVMKEELERLNRQVAVSTRQIGTLEQALVESRRAMHLDALTRIPNRRALEEWISSQLYDSGRLIRPYCLLVLDLDHFKHINDVHGHLAGDRVLAESARRLLAGIRDKDFLARYGGEEFVVVLPECPLSISEAVARRLCTLLERKPISHQGADIGVTASIGVALAADGEAFGEVFERADRCVYLAKEAGRNRVVSENALGPAAPLEAPQAAAS